MKRYQYEKLKGKLKGLHEWVGKDAIYRSPHRYILDTRRWREQGKEDYEVEE